MMANKYTVLALLYILSQSVRVYCYILVNETLSMNAAEQYCRSTYNATLASLHNSNDWGNAYTAYFPIKHMYTTWIGLVRDLNTMQNWSWTDNSPFNYTLWDSVIEIVADCTVMNQISGHWDNAVCSDLKPFLCNDINTLPTSNPTTSPTKIPSIWTGNYGVSVKVTFEYLFTKNETKGIIFIVDGITKKLVNDTVNSDCVLSNDYNFNAIRIGTEFTMIDGTILVCDEAVEEQLLVAIVDNSIDLQTTILTDINQQTDLNIDMNKIVLQIDCIYMCDGQMQTTSHVMTTINIENENLKDNTSTFWYILYVIGSIVVCCTILLCLVMYIRLKKQKRIDSEMTIKLSPPMKPISTKGRKQSGYYIETTEMSPRSIKDMSSVGCINFIMEDNDEKDIECTNIDTKHDNKESNTISSGTVSSNANTMSNEITEKQETNTNESEGEINSNEDIGENIVTMGYETAGKFENKSVHIHNESFVIESDEDNDFGNTPNGVTIQPGMENENAFEENNSDDARRYSTAL